MPAMHLLIPYASTQSDACQTALAALKLPNLDKLLGRLSPQPLELGELSSWSPPHERALARAQGLPLVDGQIPWAAAQARKQAELAGLASLSQAWAFVSLCNWQLGTHEVTMRQIPIGDLSTDDAEALRLDMAPYFAQDGITLHPYTPACWLAHGELFARFRSASPDRVQGRNLEPWTPGTAEAGAVMRLVSEMQMLLYTHPLNDAREARGALPVNALWFSGAGALPANTPPLTSPAELTVLADLRIAALAQDWPAWTAAWQHIDATTVRDLLAAQRRDEPLQLTLCGERHAQSWLSQPLGLFQRFMGHFGSQPSSKLLKAL